MSENHRRLFWSTPNKTTPRWVNNRTTTDLFTIFFFVYSKIFFAPTAILWTNIRTKILSDYQSSVLEIYWVSTKISKKRESTNYHQNNYDYENNYFLLHWIKKFSSPKMRNRQFVFAPKIEYELVAERGEANQNSLTFPTWCARRDSNPRPLGPKPSALSAELRAHTMCARVVQYNIPSITL